jgi:threonine dehydrogenase-like Zn-dependent dehydrogenase
VTTGGRAAPMTTSVAAVMEGPGRIALRELEVPEPEPGAVVVAIHLSGICGTDKHTFRGESKQYAGTKHERDLEYPLTCGHENVGTVAAIGGPVFASDGTPLAVGDRIVPGANVPCGHCYYCLNDYPYYFCQNLEDYGNSLNLSRPPGLFGGWSEYLYLLPGTPLFRVPDALPDEVAVITEVMAVTHGVDTALTLLGLHGGTRSGFSVAVLGIGPLGLCHLVKSRMLGAGFVAASDVLAGRLERAAAFGIDLALDATALDPDDRLDAVLDATGGRGVDVALDCSGVPATFTESLQFVRTGGVVVEAGAFVDMGPVQINPNSAICSRNVSVIGVGGEMATQYEPSMRLMVANLDRYPLREIVSHVLPLDQAQDAVMLAQSGQAMQVALDPRLPLGTRRQFEESRTG